MSESTNGLRQVFSKSFREPPKAWEVVKVGFAGEVRVGRQRTPAHQKGDHICPYLRVANVLDGWISYEDVLEMNFTPAEQTIFMLKPGDVLLNEGQSLELVGRPAIFSGPADTYCFQNTLVRFRPRADVDARFALAVFKTYMESGFFQVFAKRTVNIAHLGGDRFASMPFPMPPLPTQRAIADFLDRKTSAIDALIEKKERQLALLAEKRAALIHRAVTKGLDPGVPMKDSGVPWIGQIPRHWSLAPLYSRYSVQLGKMLDASRATGEHSAPYLRNANVHWDLVDTTDLKFMDFSAGDRAKYRLRPGDILTCEGGANQNVVGRSAVWNGEIDGCYYQKALHRIRRERQGEHPRFLLFSIWMASNVGAFVADSNANIYHLTAEKLRVMRFPFPPGEEQEAIVAAVDALKQTVSEAGERIRHQIEALREYRQALITAAVTGQLDISAEAR